jgi:hypothetical protein
MQRATGREPGASLLVEHAPADPAEGTEPMGCTLGSLLTDTGLNAELRGDASITGLAAEMALLMLVSS